jgi:N-acetyl-alpha-D-muramate 1-phosphate uridylyltransferase
MTRPMPPLMVFAAGLGTRMGAMTQDRPKPLIPVGGRTLLDRALDLAAAADVTRAVINTHYLAPMIAAHLRGRTEDRPALTLSHEEGQILETGGGLRKARALLGEEVVLTLNPDVVWTGENPLRALVAAWDPARMDALISVLPTAQAGGYSGSGDFVMASDGRLSRASGRPGVAYLGAQMVALRALDDVAEEVFSMNRVWDRMIAEGRLYGCLHSGGWHDVGRPEAIAGAEALLRTGAGVGG